MRDTPENVHASIGKAILAVQYFEQWLVNAYYHMRIVTEDGLSLTEAQLSDHRLFKTPTKNLLKALSAKSLIAPNLEIRIGDLLEKRHTIVHRWFLDNGTPFAHTPQQWRKLGDLADGVASEALELSWLLISYLHNWLGDTLANASPSQQHSRMSRMFKDIENAPNNSFKPKPLRGST